jgi:hypothetical protein
VNLAIGEPANEVRAELGEPLRIVWAFNRSINPPTLVFERRDGAWVSTWAKDLDVSKGTRMDMLQPLKARAVLEAWGYSKSCIPDDSRRNRVVVFEHDRVTAKESGVYFD